MSTVDKLSMSLDDIVKSQPYEAAKPPPESAESAERFARAMGVRPGKGSFNTRRSFGGKGKGYTRESSGSCTIKITNIPEDLTWRDVKQSFGAVGPVEFCNVEESRRGGNQAIVTFRDAQDAQTAIDNYDGGEMNGRKIRAFFV
ncbi:RNA binding protein, putative [Perkinsus marinus ATCC 50983]|uniref:RNA binding protein, putative n=1 Tax=Perkinsus marinus (strain ATCC 50983 / TXsc) TaxID=423536 RepID=C5LLS1_PERM5|nr:RNA binding protein, putative [Perkinsus marinus ATCC 50983]EER02293.1 RNA binding protein, putative [Perkinsus marinus ATCC 50983]|eukprot:XP_002769575.1 RNA binding protein, putative [Perkinsus marinus ATCC 50983]